MIIDPLYFLIAFCIGLLYTYVNPLKVDIITKYPTPFNDLIYTDDSGVYYKFRLLETPCPEDGVAYNPLLNK